MAAHKVKVKIIPACFLIRDFVQNDFEAKLIIGLSMPTDRTWRCSGINIFHWTIYGFEGWKKNCHRISRFRMNPAIKSCIGATCKRFSVDLRSWSTKWNCRFFLIWVALSFFRFSFFLSFFFNPVFFTHHCIVETIYLKFWWEIQTFSDLPFFQQV